MAIAWNAAAVAISIYLLYWLIKKCISSILLFVFFFILKLPLVFTFSPVKQVERLCFLCCTLAYIPMLQFGFSRVFLVCLSLFILPSFLPSFCSSIHKSSVLLKPETHHNKAISFEHQSSFHYIQTTVCVHAGVCVV